MHETKDLPTRIEAAYTATVLSPPLYPAVGRERSRNGLPITDRGLAAMKGPTRAVYVRVNRCENVTRRGVDEFLNAQSKKWIVT